MPSERTIITGNRRFDMRHRSDNAVTRGQLEAQSALLSSLSYRFDRFAGCGSFVVTLPPVVINELLT